MSTFSSFKKRIDDIFERHSVKLRRFSRQHYFDRRAVSGLFRGRKLTWRHLKYLPKILTQAERRRISVLAIALVIALAGLAVNLFFVFTQSVPKSGGEYAEGLVGSPRFLNPILSQTNSVDGDLSALIFSSLVAYDKDHKLVNDLADSYEISPDQLSYTFHLKQNVKWHDGEPFKADDVVFTVSAIEDTEFKSPLGREFRGVVCEKVDDYTVRFTLKEPFAPFISMLTFGILPEHLWYNITPANADLNELNKKPIGTGPWKVDSFKKDKSGLIKSYTLAPNADFYGRKPYLSKLIFKFYGDNMSAIEALKNKNVDGIGYLPLELKNELRKHNNIAYHEMDQPQYAAIFFNQRKNSLLQADYVRQALALSINKEKIVNQVFSGDAKTLDAPILPGVDNNPDIVKYAYNQEAAASLLSKNGWVMTVSTTPDGLTEQVRRKNNFVLAITLTVPDQPQYLQTAKIIQDSWAQIGVKTTLEIVDKAKIVSDNIAGRKYEALLFSENMSSDPDPFAFWHSSQNEYPGTNLAVFSDKTVDGLLEAARKYNNLDDRKAKYWEFQKIISSKLPVIFLYSPLYSYPQDKKVRGFDVGLIASYSDRFSNLSDWYVKTKRIWKVDKR